MTQGDTTNQEAVLTGELRTLQERQCDGERRLKAIEYRLTGLEAETVRFDPVRRGDGEHGTATRVRLHGEGSSELKRKIPWPLRALGYAGIVLFVMICIDSVLTTGRIFQ